MNEQPAMPEIGIVFVATPRIISVVDDDDAVRRATSSLLRSLGFSVRVFVSAEEFLMSDSADVSACILSDVNMDGMSGIELFARLRGKASATPFIFITGVPEAEVRKTVGSDIRILQKPVMADLLAECIEDVLTPAP